MEAKTSDQKYGLKFTQAQISAVYYDMESMLDDELMELNQGKITETGRTTRVWSAVKAGTPITKADWAWFQSTVLENIIDIAKDHDDAAGRGRIRCARAMMNKVNQLWSGPPFMKPAEPKLEMIELKRHGSDLPICPECLHNNAMLSENQGAAIFRCRDCNFRCTSVCTINLDEPKGNTVKLNQMEKAVLVAMAESAIDSTAGDFGCTDEVKVNGLTQHQLGGYMSELQKKKLLSLCPTDVNGTPIVQYVLNPEGWVLAGFPEYADR